MKREFLEGLGLEKEVIDKIMAEHGKGIEKYKTEIETKETEVNQLREQLEEANTQIESFKEMDIERIKAAADEYKQKFEEAKAKAKEDMEKLQFDHLLEKTLSGAKARNAKAVKALLDMEGLKLNNGEIVGLNEQLEKIKEENEYLFEVEDTDPAPQFTTNTNKIVDNSTKKFNYTDILEKANIRK